MAVKTETRCARKVCTLFDASVVYRIGMGEFALEMQNLTDQYYVT